MVCKILLSISYTAERAENQLFMAVLCKMYEMCVIKRCSCSINFYAQFREREQCRAAVALHKDEGSYVVDGHVLNIA